MKKVLSVQFNPPSAIAKVSCYINGSTQEALLSKETPYHCLKKSENYVGWGYIFACLFTLGQFRLSLVAMVG